MLLSYKKVDNNNYKIAFNIQKQLWPDETDLRNFIDKANDTREDNISFIVYLDEKPIGITGVYKEDIDDDSLWLDWFGILHEYRGRGYGKKVLLDTIDYCKKLNNYEYLRLDTIYWDGRPAIYLYDNVMTFKEKYTKENNDDFKNCWIYTYSLNGKNELWNNRFLGLTDYYLNCRD